MRTPHPTMPFYITISSYNGYRMISPQRHRVSGSVRGREDSRLLRSRSERDGDVQDGSAVLRVQGRIRRRRTPGRVGQKLDQDQPEQRPAPAAATVVHHDNGGDDDSGRGYLGVCSRTSAAGG